MLVSPRPFISCIVGKLAKRLRKVHFLLLMGMYLQGTQKSVQAWVTHGLAVKMGLQLGLHSREASEGYSPLEQEIRKRTWYACIYWTAPSA